MAASRDAEVLESMRRYRHAVLATTGRSGEPQAALIGVAVSDAFELVFDTLASTRKSANLQRDPRVAVVFGGDGDACTVQYQGVAEEPSGEDLVRAQALYFAKFADGRSRLLWPGIVYYRVRPVWLRFSDYRGGGEPRVFELDAAAGHVWSPSTT